VTQLTTTDLPAISASVVDANTELATVASTAALVEVAARLVDDSAAGTAIASASVTTNVAAGSAQVDAYGPSGSAELDVTQVESIKQFFDVIAARATQLATYGSSAAAAAAALYTEVTAIETSVAAAQVATAAVAASVATATTAVGGISTAVLAISAANTSVETEIAEATDALYDHVAAFLSEDCKANLVVVPILTLDAAGFYSAPSVGLIDSLQNYLDERKEVTHTVSVTSGANFLVPAVISIRVGVKRGTTSEQAVKTSVIAAVDSLLRNRAFGSPLYESDVEQVVRQVSGVVFSNVTISGPVGKLDGSGNLIPLESEVITKGTVAVTTEIASF
jgi:hypothetical protein